MAVRIFIPLLLENCKSVVKSKKRKFYIIYANLFSLFTITYPTPREQAVMHIKQAQSSGFERLARFVPFY